MRWLKYKEGFSAELVQALLAHTSAKTVLDPFSGSGTSALTASSLGMRGTGIELMPLGNMAARAIIAASNGLQYDEYARASNGLIDALSADIYDDALLFPHVPITEHAFPEDTEKDLAKAREYISGIADSSLSTILTLACVSVLEEVSYTRKDGQFLRWDPQSGRKVSRKLHKASLPRLSEALRRRLDEIAEDLPSLKQKYGGSIPEFIDGSSLTELRKMPAESFDAVVTSPPMPTATITPAYMPWSWLTWDTMTRVSRNCARNFFPQRWKTVPSGNNWPGNTGTRPNFSRRWR